MIQHPVQAFTIHNQHLLLHPFRAVYWREEGALLLADLHLGKERHFRREGFAVPQGAADETWDRLLGLLVDLRPRRVLLLGDLFHSDYNREWEDFCDLTHQFSDVAFELIRGNHDLLAPEDYRRARLIVHEGALLLAPFLLTHHPLPVVPAGRYNLCGHLHPCVVLQGTARQRLRLPCFHFGTEQGLLPAFGRFTGMQPVRPREGDRVFVIGADEVVEVV